MRLNFQILGHRFYIIKKLFSVMSFLNPMLYTTGVIWKYQNIVYSSCIVQWSGELSLTFLKMIRRLLS